MSCPNCNKNLNIGKYICKEDGYKVIDLNNNVIFTAFEETFSSDDGELDDYHYVKYCDCGYYEKYIKPIETEYELIQVVFEDSKTTKTINEAIQKIVDIEIGTTEEIKNMLKSHNPSVTDWSF